MVKTKKDPNRYLLDRGGRWFYYRRVPGHAVAMDGRAPFVRDALGTSDLREARHERDKLDLINERIWRAIKAHLGAGKDAAMRATAKELEEALDLPPLPDTDLNRQDVRDALIDRVLAAAAFTFGEGRRPTNEQMQEAAPIMRVAGGRHHVPDGLMVSGLAAFYCDEIKGAAMIGKSESQRKTARRWPTAACDTFIEVCGDMPVDAITKEHGRKLFKHWTEKLKTLNPKTGRSYSYESAERCLDELSRMVRAVAAWKDIEDYRDPFKGFEFEREERRRAPVPLEDLKRVLADRSELAGLDREARGILLIAAETGLRLSEAANIRGAHIRIDGEEVPHVLVAPVTQGPDRRQVKTPASRREIPLTGLALEVCKAFPLGFARWRGKEDALSGELSRYVREKRLWPEEDRDGRPISAAHSLRHLWKDRCRSADIREDMIDFLGGWRRPGVEYGTGFDLATKRQAIEKIALPYDPDILT